MSKDYNNEFSSALQSLKNKRNIVINELTQLSKEKDLLQREIAKLSEKLHFTNELISKKSKQKNDYDRTINETENAYTKIIESQETLLQVLKRQSKTLS
mmetsp:Transcript_74037/g.90881  ORF Transcript_74037/g.90881 Transcript_74037/m.90881 type:complete len:99 (-) Transcript_74037:31-327(-)